MGSIDKEKIYVLDKKFIRFIGTINISYLVNYHAYVKLEKFIGHNPYNYVYSDLNFIHEDVLNNVDLRLATEKELQSIKVLYD